MEAADDMSLPARIFACGEQSPNDASQLEHFLFSDMTGIDNNELHYQQPPLQLSTNGEAQFCFSLLADSGAQNPNSNQLVQQASWLQDHYGMALQFLQIQQVQMENLMIMWKQTLQHLPEEISLAPYLQMSFQFDVPVPALSSAASEVTNLISLPNSSTSTTFTSVHSSGIEDRQPEISEHFGVPRTTIYGIIKNKQMFLDQIARQPQTPVALEAYRLTESPFQILEDLLAIWIKDLKSMSVPVPGKKIMAQAGKIHRILSNIYLDPLPPCMFTSGWLAGFKKRQNIKLKSVDSNSNAVEEHKAMCYKPHKIKENNRDDICSIAITRLMLGWSYETATAEKVYIRFHMYMLEYRTSRGKRRAYDIGGMQHVGFKVPKCRGTSGGHGSSIRNSNLVAVGSLEYMCSALPTVGAANAKAK
ncbi:hypothetical protein BGX26_001360 [Mortierella sp. AD094]|nr:hypothetical protein BGX26_001360 [Mortierella sp. AD094]